MRLAPISTVGDSERGRAALALLLTADPFLAHMDAVGAFEQDTMAFNWRPDTATATLQGRDLGGAYTPADQTPAALQTAEQALMGDSIKSDIALIRDQELGGNKMELWFDKRLRTRFTDWAEKLGVRLWQGSGTGAPRQMKGLLKIYDGTADLPGFTGEKGVLEAHTMAGVANSLDVTAEANWDDFIRVMISAMAKVKNPTAICCNKELYSLITIIAHEKHIKGESRDQFGNPVTTFNNVPIICLADGCITNTEPDAAGSPVNNTTSLFISGLAEGRGAVVTNSGLYFNEQKRPGTDQIELIDWEFRGEWKFEDKRAMRRIRRIKAV